MQEAPFLTLRDWCQSIDLAAHLASPAALAAKQVGPGSAATVADGVAIIELRGTLMKHQASLAASTSTVLARRQLREAVANSQVARIVLRIESPGGTVAGTRELADEVAAAAKKKPVLAYIEDVGASAAYWVASQATRVVANATALVGSIGTYGIVHDASAAAEQRGIKVHVVRAGDFKGMFEPGTKVTDAQLAELQRIVNQQNQFFLSAVAAGRKRSADEVAKWADGRTFLAAEAKQLGLIDAVQSFDVALAGFTSDLPSSKKGQNPMTQQTNDVATRWRAAVAAAEQTGLTGDEAFVAAAKSNPELWQAFARSMGIPMAEVAARAPGVDPLPAGSARRQAQSGASASSGDATSQWKEALAEKVAAGIPKAKAVSQLVREQPELHQAYIDEANSR